MSPANRDRILRFIAEIIGTGILVFLGCLGCISTVKFPNNNFQASMNFGLAVLVAIQVIGCITGAHLNPSVTVAAFVYKSLNLSMAAIYIMAQLIGGFLGYALLTAVVPRNVVDVIDAKHALCITVPHGDITYLQAFVIEFTITSILVLVCCAVWDPRNSTNTDSTPLRFGLIISCLAFSAGSFTGASMNPARSFGPALWNADFEGHWIYWVAPLSSALITSTAYTTIFKPKIGDDMEIK